MTSPFPGMDPYLEAALWPDVHNALASKLRAFLAPQLLPKYAARLEIYVVEYTSWESEIGILVPTPAPLTLPVIQPIEVRIPSIEIRDTLNNVLVSCIEIISPANKREPGLTDYRKKRQRLYNAKVHLIEIDLLRRGTRPFNHPRLPDVPYLVTLTRAESGVIDVWPVTLQDTLPTIPVPLRQPDPDAVLDLQAALNAIYDEAAYDLSINYTQSSPPPAFNDVDKQWIQARCS
ncbi:DUF4058 family protein [Iningainema tapete]|uniref:DUF4058 family protein n=1 Tax=Iningainema tapete BLCC-T55 TaxID=2748662 RepID=A0A8J6XEW5_9CYAN|nr:DUF4058 family protein [Iningainema tapete]MBD2771475.1 DUF4058 family protein [Iningainema tapete BLCC-T55]